MTAVPVPTPAPSAGTPSHIFPNQSQTCINRDDADFAWTSVAPGVVYQLQVGTICGFPTGGGIDDPWPITPTYSTLNTNYTVDGLDPQTKYYWRVRAESPLRRLGALVGLPSVHDQRPGNGPDRHAPRPLGNMCPHEPGPELG